MTREEIQCGDYVRIFYGSDFYRSGTVVAIDRDGYEVRFSYGGKTWVDWVRKSQVC